MKTIINNKDTKAKQVVTSTKVQDGKAAGKKTATETNVNPSAKDMKDSLPTKK